MGYWATGNCGMASAPASRINRATTQAKIGRSIKNCGMVKDPYWPEAWAGGGVLSST